MSRALLLSLCIACAPEPTPFVDAAPVVQIDAKLVESLDGDVEVPLDARLRYRIHLDGLNIERVRLTNHRTAMSLSELQLDPSLDVVEMAGDISLFPGLSSSQQEVVREGGVLQVFGAGEAARIGAGQEPCEEYVDVIDRWGRLIGTRCTICKAI